MARMYLQLLQHLKGNDIIFNRYLKCSEICPHGQDVLAAASTPSKGIYIIFNRYLKCSELDPHGQDVLAAASTPSRE